MILTPNSADLTTSMSSFQCHRQADRFLGFPPVPFPFYWPDLYSCNPAFNLHLEGFVYLIVIYYGFTVLSQKSLYVCLETQCLFIVLRRLSHVVRLHVCAHSFKGIPFFFVFFVSHLKRFVTNSEFNFSKQPRRSRVA